MSDAIEQGKKIHSEIEDALKNTDVKKLAGRIAGIMGAMSAAYLWLGGMYGRKPKHLNRRQKRERARTRREERKARRQIQDLGVAKLLMECTRHLRERYGVGAPTTQEEADHLRSLLKQDNMEFVCNGGTITFRQKKPPKVDVTWVRDSTMTTFKGMKDIEPHEAP